MNIKKQSIRSITLTALAFLSSINGEETKAQTGTQDIKKLQTETIKAVVKNLQEKHVCPKPIDDHFSKIIWKKYLESLDPNRSVLLKTDFQSLKKYELKIDDELLNGSTEFFNAAFTIYQHRINEAAAGYQKILSRPVNLNKDDNIQLNGSLAEYCQDKKALEKVWLGRARYHILKKINDLEKGKLKGSELESEARKKVGAWLNKFFKTLAGEYALNQKFSQYINTITLEVDPHTNYYEPAAAKIVNDDFAKRYFGIGIELADQEGDVIVKSVSPGGVAIKSGLIDVNDKILRISNTKGEMLDVEGLPITEVANLVRGEKDAKISLDLLKSDGKEISVSLKRAEINQDESRAKSAVMEHDGKKIGYICLPEFYDDFANANGIHSAADVEKEINRLKAQSVEGIIVDLRNNGGGSLQQVVTMSGLFVGAGPIVQIKDPKAHKIYRSEKAPIYDGPLIVMINENSASASEIFAAAMQDYKRGIIIGSPASFGKGTAQATLPMGKMGDRKLGIPSVSYGSLRLTQHQFYRVNGASTQLRGVAADVILPSSYAYLKNREKDKITALDWDSIAPLKYTESNAATSWKNTLDIARAAVKNSSAFNIIDENSKSLSHEQLKPTELSKVKFDKQQKKLAEYLARIEQASRLPDNGKIKVYGLPEMTGSPDNQWYAKWINGLSTDLYIEKGILIMNKIIASSHQLN